MKPAEIVIFEFLSDSISSAPVDSPIYDCELHDTVYQTIRTKHCIRVSEAVSELAVDVTQEMKEFDAELVIAVCVKVEGKDKKERQASIQRLFEIQQAVTKLLTEDGTLGGRVCDSLVRRSFRGFDVLDGEPWAVANIPVVINPRSLGY